MHCTALLTQISVDRTIACFSPRSLMIAWIMDFSTSDVMGAAQTGRLSQPPLSTANRFGLSRFFGILSLMLYGAARPDLLFNRASLARACALCTLCSCGEAVVVV